MNSVLEKKVLVPKKQNMSASLALLNLMAWIRRQVWLRAVYKHLPIDWRNRVSETTVSNVSRQVKFPQSSSWKAATLSSPMPVIGATSTHEYGEGAGVNVYASVRGQFGLSESARSYIRALLAEGYPVSVFDVPLDIPHSMGDCSLESHINKGPVHGINLIFINPDYLDEAIESIGPERLENCYTIACWFWELESFPSEWLPAVQRVDEIMVSSRFVQKIVEAVTDKPVLSVPLPVGAVEDSGLSRSDFDIEEDAFVFLNSFDFNSSLARKNPLAVIDAFCRAFPDKKSRARLLIKSSNGYRYPEMLRKLLNAAGSDHRILVRDDIIGRGDMQALQRCVDAYVSLHRAEGFGLGLAECMRLGKPVIATAWSGNMEYMTRDNSCLVDYQLIPVNEGEYVHHTGQRWADPCIDQAAAHMRRLVEDPEFAACIGERAAADIREKLSPHLAAQKIIQRLNALA